MIMPKLLVTYDKQTLEHRFDRYAAIGRSSRCNVRIKDIKLSRVHAEIIEDDGDFILVDLRSQNGTKLNGKEVHEAILQESDVIHLGRARIVFSRTPHPSPKESDPLHEENTL